MEKKTYPETIIGMMLIASWYVGSANRITSSFEKKVMAIENNTIEYVISF
jgi:hypothetical protein